MKKLVVETIEGKREMIERIEREFHLPCVCVDGNTVGVEEWERMGRPRLLMKAGSFTDRDNQILLYEDVGYGCLFPVVNGEVYQGRDFVTDPTNEWVGLSEYFTGNGPLLYRRV